MMGLVAEMSKSKIDTSAPVQMQTDIPKPAAEVPYTGPIIRPATFSPDSEMDSLTSAFKTLGKGRGKGARKTRKIKRSNELKKTF